jgi:hypothetical protein
MPIIQSNGSVESHWATLKKWHLRASSRPIPVLTCSIIMDSFFQDRYSRITLYRLGRIRSSADRGFMQSWRSAKSRNRAELMDGGVVNVKALRTLPTMQIVSEASLTDLKWGNQNMDQH